MNDDKRWETRFGAWAKQHGIQRMVQELRNQGHSVTVSAAYYWFRPGGTAPKPKHAQAIVELSERQLALDDIYSHQAELLAKAAASGTAAEAPAGECVQQ